MMIDLHFSSSSLVFGCGLTRPTVVGREADRKIINVYQKIVIVGDNGTLWLFIHLIIMCIYLLHEEEEKVQVALKLHVKRK